MNLRTELLKLKRVVTYLGIECSKVSGISEKGLRVTIGCFKTTVIIIDNRVKQIGKYQVSMRVRSINTNSGIQILNAYNIIKNIVNFFPYCISGVVDFCYSFDLPYYSRYK